MARLSVENVTQLHANMSFVTGHQLIVCVMSLEHLWQFSDFGNLSNVDREGNLTHKTKKKFAGRMV